MIILPELKYPYNALEPYISEETLHFHHDKHHQTYVDKLNEALAKDPSLDGKSIEEILSDVSVVREDIKTAIINNGGGHYNHSFYWESMAPNTGFDESLEIVKEIVKKFGSFEEFKKSLSQRALGRFGSGYAWLVLNNQELEIVDTLNQECPLSNGLKPLLCIDVWEHSYYLQYQNKRADYIDSWWNVVNWANVNTRFLSYI